jgi:glycosyltransferase involved in cell wall biosynthesis
MTQEQASTKYSMMQKKFIINHHANEKTLPLVSIITVTLNSGPLLKKTILSVIEQTYPRIEFIIIDGGSTDSTFRLIRENRQNISYFKSEKDNGIYDAMNKGLLQSKGEYVQFLNAGEYYCNIRSLSDILNSAGNEYDIIYGDIFLKDKKRSLMRHHKAMHFSLNNLKQFGTGVLCHQAMLVRRNIAVPYNCNYKYKAELNWYFDLAQRNPPPSVYHLKKPFVVYSLGGAGYNNFLHNRIEWYKLLASRFGIKTVINHKFIKFVMKDFSNRYHFIDVIKHYLKK